MKKEHKLLLAVAAAFLLIAAFMLVQNVQAQESPVPDVLGIKLTPENLEKMPQSPEELANATKNYLLQEWGKNLRNENTTLGRIFSPIFKGYDKISPYTDVFFKYTIGMEPSLSWLFILTFTLWIALVIYIFRIMTVFSSFSKWASIIISLCLIVIISNFGIPKWVASKIIALISILTTWWMQLIAALLVIIALIAASLLSEKFKDVMGEWKEKREKMKALQDIDLLKLKEKGHEAVERALTRGLGE